MERRYLYFDVNDGRCYEQYKYQIQLILVLPMLKIIELVLYDGKHIEVKVLKAIKRWRGKIKQHQLQTT